MLPKQKTSIHIICIADDNYLDRKEMCLIFFVFTDHSTAKHSPKNYVWLTIAAFYFQSFIKGPKGTYYKTIKNSQQKIVELGQIMSFCMTNRN